MAPCTQPGGGDISHVIVHSLETTTVERNLRLAAKLGATVRHLGMADKDDGKGNGSSWHRGESTELLTWHDPRGIRRQELTFAGAVIELERGKGVRAGAAPPQEVDGRGMLELDRALANAVLHYASELLRSVPRRDLILQHLIKAVHEALLAEHDETATRPVKVEGITELFKFRSEVTPLPSYNPLRKRLPSWVGESLLVGLFISIVLATAGLLFWLAT